MTGIGYYPRIGDAELVHRLESAGASLLKFRDRVDPKRSGTPRTLGVIVSSGYGYLREDGVAVIPIAALGP